MQHGQQVWLVVNIIISILLVMTWWIRDVPPTIPEPAPIIIQASEPQPVGQQDWQSTDVQVTTPNPHNKRDPIVVSFVHPVRVHEQPLLIQPEHDYQVRWLNERQCELIPQRAWRPATRYQLRLNPELETAEPETGKRAPLSSASLSSLTWQFNTQPLTLKQVKLDQSGHSAISNDEPLLCYLTWSLPVLPPEVMALLDVTWQDRDGDWHVAKAQVFDENAENTDFYL